MICPYCNRKPSEIHKYIEESKKFKLSPADYVRMEVNTYDPETDMFCCQICYLTTGMPLRRDLIKAFRRYRNTVLKFEGVKNV